MASPDICVPWVISNEDFDPPRCETVMDSNGFRVISGINEKFWPAEFALINAQPQALRLPMVVSFYTRRYWNTWLEQLTSNAIAAVTMDADVNEGQEMGVSILQEAVGACGSVVAVDGQFGPVTLAAVNSVPIARLLPSFQAARESAYRKIGGPNLDAWLKRAAKIPPFD